MVLLQNPRVIHFIQLKLISLLFWEKTNSATFLSAQVPVDEPPDVQRPHDTEQVVLMPK